MPTDLDCIFCRIATGQISAQVVLQRPGCLAFLDVAPQSEGHLLLIPTEHYVRLDEMPADRTGEMLANLPSLGQAVVEATGAAGFNVLQNNGRVAGQEIQHVHFHIIPRDQRDGLGYRWHPKSYPEGRADELCARIKKLLAG